MTASVLEPAPAEATAAGPALAPSASRGGYLTLVVALLVAGASAGFLVHGYLFSRDWLKALQGCAVQSGPQPSDPFQRGAWYARLEHCTAPAQHIKAWVCLGGAGVALLLGVVLMVVLAQGQVRRGRPEPAPGRVQKRAAELAASAGLRRAPRVVVGSCGLRSPYSAGRPGRATILLPQGLLARPDAVVDAVLRHEIAHIVAGDVTLVWFARGVWWAMLPVLLTPLAVLEVLESRTTNANWAGAAQFDGDYLARGGLLLVVAAVLSASVLRAREHEADLRAAQSRVGAGAFDDALVGLVAVARLPARWWRRPFATHPAPDLRVAVLHTPSLFAAPRPADTFCLAALLATTWWGVNTVAQPLLVGTVLDGDFSPVSGVLSGALLAATLGVGLWRQAMTGASWPGRGRVLLLAGFVLGAVTGQCASVAAAGTGWWGPWQHPLTLFLPVVFLLGAIGVSRAVASLWAGPRGTAVPSRAATVTVFLINLAVFAAATTFGYDTQIWSEPVGAGWWYAFYLPATTLDVPTVVVMLAIAAAVAVRLLQRARHRHPATGRRGDWLVLPATGLAAAAAALLVRWLATGPTGQTWTEQIGLDGWVAAAAGIGCVLAAAGLAGLQGMGRSLATGPAATLITAGVLYLIRNGSWNSPSFRDPTAAAGLYAKTSLPMLAVTVLIVGVTALAPRSQAPLSLIRNHRWLLPVTTAVVSALVSLFLLRSGAPLLPLGVPQDVRVSAVRIDTHMIRLDTQEEVLPEALQGVESGAQHIWSTHATTTLR